MKKLLLLFSCLLVFAANAQNGFTSFTTNIVVTGGVKLQTAFLVDNNSNKWIGFRTITSGTNIANAGLLKYDNSNWTLYNQTSTPAFPSNNVSALAKDNSGNIWIGTNDVGLVKFDGTSFTIYNTSHGLPTNSITCIETIANQVYIGTTAGLSRFDGITFTNYNVANGKLAHNLIYSIKAENSNLIWLGGGDRLTEFNINTSYTTSNYVDHIGTGRVNCIYIDSQNSKWLGTLTQGILKFSGSSFQNANTIFDIYGSSIPSLVRDIATGPHNGIIFTHVNGTSTNSSVFSGLTELAPNGNVYQYFYPISNYTLGNLIENDGSNVLILDGHLPLVYQNLNPINNSYPFGSVNNNNFKTLDINNVRAGIANRGDMHWDIAGNGNALYEVPKGSGKNSNFASALWIGGLDAGNQLHGAAQTYRQGGVDFWPGPLKLTDASIDAATSSQYDKIWKVSYTEINDFINNYNSGNVQNGSFTIPNDILTWPGNGDVNNNQAALLAPFVDINSDGVYNPMDGDYPKIKGDQALFFVYNDNLAAHSTSFTPMGIEVHGMAYAYGCPAVVNGHNELTYTTFYDYKIINRSANNYHDVFVSMWSDVDLGYYGDDYIGSNVTDNYGFAYNADLNDETVAGTQGYGNYIPAQGFNIVKGPLANLNDGIDNNNNGVIDEPNEDCKLNKFNFFNNSFAGVPLQTTDPSNGAEFYNVMNGKWKDGTPLTCGGSGYGGITNVNWAYSGDPVNNGVNTDPFNTCGYWIENGVAGDRRMILSSGPFSMAPGQIQEVEYAFVTSFDSSATFGGTMSLGKLKSDIQKVNTFYNLSNKPNCLQSISVGITEVPKQNDFSLFPNPAKSLITISSTISGTVKVNYEIVDVLGKVVMQNDNENSEKFSININDLNSGIYFLRLQVNNSIVVKKFVKE
ncbi:MAG TPA: T9SS type A sorting domain-containing protein [Bacteroidia bacterium]|nr:T9SS type A sorting domain-containing protein [Bacteroidia bacterium]